MRLPPVTRSLRFRVSGMTSAVAFSIGGLALAALYVALLVRVRGMTMRTVVLTHQPAEIGGQTVVLSQLAEQEFRTFESIFKEAILNQVALVTLAALVIVFLLSLIVGWFVAGRALKPVGQITNVAKEIEATDLSRRIALDGPDDELTVMASTFDGMLDRLDRAFQTQKRFLAQTSHDLRTPLTVIRSNLDVTLLDDAAEVEEWRTTGEIVSRAAERMSVMIDDLLAAARMEMSEASLVSLDLADVVDQVGEEFRTRAAAVGIELVARSEPVHLEGQSVPLLRALANLVDNALRLAPPGSSVTIASGQLDGWAYLGVADRGPGLDPATLRGAGTGLGLSIVRDVAAAHGGRVEAIGRSDGGSFVAMWIPVGGHRAPQLPLMDGLPDL